MRGEVLGFYYLGQAKRDEQFAVFRRVDDALPNGRRPTTAANGNGRPPVDPTFWPELADRLLGDLTPERRRELAETLGLPEAALGALFIGFTEKGPHKVDGQSLGPAWSFPEMDAAGHCIGISLRYKGGEKKAWPGGSRGLTVPRDWRDRPGSVHIVEGPSDVLALTAMGLAAVGRPSNMGGVEHLAELLKDLHAERPIIVLGEMDPKTNGQWPGRDGAVKVASELSKRLGRPVKWAMPPGGAKDVRAWVLAQGLDPCCADAWLDAGDRFLKEIEGKLQNPPPAQESEPAPLFGQQKGQAQQKERPAPVLIEMSAVQPSKTSWLWDKFIPRRALTILDGDPGLGKSTLTLDLAARVSRGWTMPPAGGQGNGAEPAGVLLLSAEDDPEQTLRPRLDAAGADVSRVKLFGAVRIGDEERPPVLPWDMALIESAIIEQGIVLVVVDPFMAFLDGELDSHRDQDVRRCLHQLKELAQRTGAAILLVRHLNKVGHNVAMYRGGGSIGIIGAARSALIVGRDPDDPQARVLASVKSNLGPMPRSLVYHTETVGDVSRIAWGEETDLTANDILGHPDSRGVKSRPEQCADIIRAVLAKGPVDSGDLDARCKAAGFTEYAIRQARKELGVRPL
jgi:hypothetical protein